MAFAKQRSAEARGHRPRTMGKLVRQTLHGYQPLAEWSASDRSSYDAAVAMLVILATAMGGG